MEQEERPGKYKEAYRRMFRIDELIRAEKCPSAAKIAEKLGVSKRTIQRDLHYMEIELSAPIMYDRENNGYLYQNPRYSLSAFVFTDDDLQILLLSKRLLESLFAGTFYKSKVSETFQAIINHASLMTEMLQHTVREDIQVALPDSGDFEVAEKILEAMKKRLCITAKVGSDDEILLRPVRIIYAWDSWYLLFISKDYKTNRDFKILKLNLISEIRSSTPLQSKQIPDITTNVDEWNSPDTARCTYTEKTSDGDILHILIMGKADWFHLIYRREADGSLSFVETEDSMLGGHVLETVLGMAKDVKIDL